MIKNILLASFIVISPLYLFGCSSDADKEIAQLKLEIQDLKNRIEKIEERANPFHMTPEEIQQSDQRFEEFLNRPPSGGSTDVFSIFRRD